MYYSCRRVYVTSLLTNNQFNILIYSFYEWNKKRQPFYVKRKDGQLLLFAGLYSTSVIEGVPMTTCVIITTASTVSFSKIHHRMPVILEPPQVDQWLDPSKPWNQSIIDTLSNAYQDELEW